MIGNLILHQSRRSILAYSPVFSVPGVNLDNVECLSLKRSLPLAHYARPIHA